jgi:hypothetical protein
MSHTRISYWQLPGTVRNRVADTIGTVAAAESVSEGLNNAVAAVLRTTHDRYFIKAMPAEHRWVWTQAREAQVAPFVAGVGAPLVTRIVEDGWDVLLFDALHGRQADYAPDSIDLPHVARLIARIGEVPCPDIELRQAEQRLSAFTDEANLRYFVGNTLLHTDLNPANVIVGGSGARIVDWGWATRGADWLNPAYLVTWLIVAGHEPKEAEWWADQVPAWRTAPVDGVTAFAAANALMWATHGGADPDPWTEKLVNASARWSAYRGVPSAAEPRSA